MSGTVEYVEVYPDGHEVVHPYSPLKKELSRICADDELTYEQQYEDGVCDGLTPLAIVIDGYSGATEYLHLKSELKPKVVYEDTFKASATYRLTRIVHHVEYPDPPTTGLWLDRENNVVWFDHPREYYTLIADSGCDYLHGLDYTPKPPFKPLITAMEIINKQEVSNEQA